MKVVDYTIISLLCSFLCIHHVTSQACSPGWFGPSCRYKCHCADAKCDRRTGQCPGTCHKGWFGPQCQYVDLAQQKSETAQLTDGLDRTCNTNSKESETVTFDRAYYFTWLRVHVSEPDALKRNLIVTFNTNNISCRNQRTATVDDRTLDIYCQLDSPVKSVTLTGDVIPSLCSIYVSGGRNVALKETAQQSTTYSEKSILYTADKSVDGNKNADFYKGQSCSCTNGGQRTPGTWNVTFSRPRYVNRYVIYNRDSAYFLLLNFTLTSFDGPGNPVFNYTDQQGEKLVYTVTHANLRMDFVQITSGYRNNILRMCEVAIYGDSACEPGQYGRECEHTCNCADGKPCFVSTGMCPSGCAPGFRGKTCSTRCGRGSYGSNCGSKCSDLCVIRNDTKESLCHHVTGLCTFGCQDGYDKLTCAQVSETRSRANLHHVQLIFAIVGCTLGAVIFIIIIPFAITASRRRRHCARNTISDCQVASASSGNCVSDGVASNGSQAKIGNAYQGAIFCNVSTQRSSVPRERQCPDYITSTDMDNNCNAYEPQDENGDDTQSTKGEQQCPDYITPPDSYNNCSAYEPLYENGDDFLSTQGIAYHTDNLSQQTTKRSSAPCNRRSQEYMTPTEIDEDSNVYEAFYENGGEVLASKSEYMNIVH